MKDEIKRRPMMTHSILYSASDIQKRVAQLGRQIAADYPGAVLDLVIILKGAAFFGADLARAIPNECRLHFLRAKSYQGDQSQELSLELSKDMELKGRQVIIVEDMVDTGNTLKVLIPTLEQEEPESLKLCTLLQKHAVEGIQPDYLGFEAPDHWLIGYGFDLDQQYRNLPHIAIYKPPES